MHCPLCAMEYDSRNLTGTRIIKTNLLFLTDWVSEGDPVEVALAHKKKPREYIQARKPHLTSPVT